MKIKKLDTNIVRIVSDGAIATPEWCNSRFIPIVSLDCTGRPDISNVLSAHEYINNGDVKVTWGYKVLETKSLYLHIEFLRPDNVDILLKFSSLEHGSVVEGIFHSKGLYIQPGVSGSSVVDGIEKLVLVEIPFDEKFFSRWRNIYEKTILRRFTKQGLSVKQAKVAAGEYLSTLSEMWDRFSNVK